MERWIVGKTKTNDETNAFIIRKATEACREKRRLVEELATTRFCAEGRNVVLLGPPGVGKTHLAIALGVAVCELGQRVYFTSAIELARHLTKATRGQPLNSFINAALSITTTLSFEAGN
jgi:DNA replication protein DnaC